MTYLFDYILNDFHPHLHNYANTSNLNDTNINYRLTDLDDKKFLIEVALPGYDKNSIEISYTNKILTINTKENKENLQNFYKEFYLDKNIKVVDANIKNGLLKINLKKIIPDEDKPKLITIN